MRYQHSRSQICIKNSACQINDSHHATQHGAHSISSPAVGIYPTSLKFHIISSLFSATPQKDLPPYLERDSFTKQQLQSTCSELPKSRWTHSDLCESFTCHPLMTDALHSLLLCQCLIQTSVHGLKRYA